MFADMPWLNNYFAKLLSDPRDITPKPYLFFYTSLSISSTYLLPVAFIAFCYIILGLISTVCKHNKETFVNIVLFLYNYFLGGLSFAVVACVQGAFLNPLQSFNLTSSSYLFGFVLFVVLLGEAIWSTVKDY